MSIYDGSRIRLYDIAADKFVDRFPAFKGDAQDLAFTNDGKKLVTVDQHGGMVRIWDVEAGKEERSFPVVPDALKKKSYRVGRTQLSPDGKTVVVTYVEDDRRSDLGRLRDPPHDVRLWDVATGKELPELTAATPSTGVFTRWPTRRHDAAGIRVCEIATGNGSRHCPTICTSAPPPFRATAAFWRRRSRRRDSNLGSGDVDQAKRIQGPPAIDATTLTFGPEGGSFGKPRHNRAGLGHPTAARRGFRVPRKRVERPGQKGSWRIVQIRGEVPGGAGGHGQVLRRKDQTRGGA